MSVYGALIGAIYIATRTIVWTIMAAAWWIILILDEAPPPSGSLWLPFLYLLKLVCAVGLAIEVFLEMRKMRKVVLSVLGQEKKV